MDNFRAFLRTVKRLHFWLICGAVMLMGLAGWFFAVKSLSDVTDTHVRDYENLFGEMDTLKRKARFAGIDFAYCSR